MKASIAENPNALYWASFNSFELRLPGQAVIEIAQSGSNDAAVAHWAPIVKRRMKADAFKNAPTPAKIRAELLSSGGWEEHELKDDAANWRRIVWMAAHNINEDDAPDCSEPLKN